MTRGQLANKIRENLDDLGISYYSIADINDSIQDAYDEIVVYSQCIEKWIDLPMNIMGSDSPNPWLNIKKFVPDYYRPIALLNQSNKMFIDPGNDREEDSYRIDWQLGSGSVYNYLINGPEWLAFPGGYTDSNNRPLRLFYKASAPELTKDDDILRILQNYTLLIELYCTADLLEQNQEFIKSTGYWNRYEPLLEEYRQKIQILSRSDRVFNRA